MAWIVRSAFRVAESGAASGRDEALAVEAPLQVAVNGLPFATTMRTPGADIELARGLLHTEGIVASGASIAWETLADPESGTIGRIHAAVAEDDLLASVDGRRTLTASASCGVCGTRRVEDIHIYGDPIRLNAQPPIALSAITALFDAMAVRQPAFQASGGCHAAAVASPSGELLAVFEDIGRHNAVDKAVGALLLDGRLSDAAALLVSGRVSYEIVAKAYRAGIPVIAAVSAPTSMAVEQAQRLGVALAGFCRNGRGTVYARPERIVETAPGLRNPKEAPWPA